MIKISLGKRKCVNFMFLLFLLLADSILNCSAFPLYTDSSSSSSSSSIRTLNSKSVATDKENSPSYPSQLYDDRFYRNRRKRHGNFHRTSENNSRLSSLSSTTTVIRRKDNNNNNNCDIQNEHFTFKAYKSDIVLLVKAQLISSRLNKKRKITIQFMKLEVLKNNKNHSFHDVILLNFTSIAKNCRKHNNFPHHFNNNNNNHNHHQTTRRTNLIRAEDIRVNEEYLLFLNAAVPATDSTSSNSKFSNNDYKIVSAALPELVGRKEKNGLLRIVRKVSDKNFSPGVSRITKLIEKSIVPNHFRKRKGRKKLKLVCRVSGLPIYKLYWKRQNVTLISNEINIRIRYVSTWSTLVIKNMTEMDYGQYECIAQSLNGTIDVKAIDVSRPIITSYTIYPNLKKPCTGDYHESLCLNNGTCFMDTNPQTLYCECPDGFSGQRCELKTLKTIEKIASMYPNNSLYTCKAGISTKFYC